MVHVGGLCSSWEETQCSASTALRGSNADRRVCPAQSETQQHVLSKKGLTLDGHEHNPTSRELWALTNQLGEPRRMRPTQAGREGWPGEGCGENTGSASTALCPPHRRSSCGHSGDLHRPGRPMFMLSTPPHFCLAPLISFRFYSYRHLLSTVWLLRK